MPGPDGKIMHSSIRINGAPIFVVDENREWNSLGPNALKGSPVTIHLYVEDADAFVAKASKAGAKVTMPVSEQFWGDRYGTIEDPYGHHWSVGTHVKDVSPKEMEQAMKKMAAQHPA